MATWARAETDYTTSALAALVVFLRGPLKAIMKLLFVPCRRSVEIKPFNLGDSQVVGRLHLITVGFKRASDFLWIDKAAVSGIRPISHFNLRRQLLEGGDCLFIRLLPCFAHGLIQFALMFSSGRVGVITYLLGQVTAQIVRRNQISKYRRGTRDGAADPMLFNSPRTYVESALRFILSRRGLAGFGRRGNTTRRERFCLPCHARLRRRLSRGAT